jgi:exopolysaccharide production protein ExoQ
MSFPVQSSISIRVITWVLLFPLLYFTARGMFSFDRAQYANTSAVDLMSLPASSSDTLSYRLERIGAYGIIIAAMIVCLRRTIKAAKRNSAVLVLPLLAAVSTLWSQDWTKTIVLAIFAFFLTCFAVYLTVRFRGTDLMKLFNITGFATVAISYLLILLYPSAGIRHIDDTGAWQGLFVHKNYLGILMAFFFATAFYQERRSRLQRFVGIAYSASIVLLILKSQSRTAWLGLCLLVLYLVVEHFYVKLAKKERGLTAMLVAAGVSLLVLVGMTYGGEIAVALGKTSDMTGRVGIFKSIYPELWKRPVSGFGYQAFWVGLKGESAHLLLMPGNTTLANAENGILQMWLELGVLGTSVLMFILLQSCRNALFCLGRDPSAFIRWNCAILFLSMIGLINGDKFMLPDTLEWVFVVTTYVNLAEEVRRIRSCAATSRRFAWEL